MRAWLYYRLSRDEDQEMNSLHNQRQILVDYAEQHGYEIVGESFDDNVTGIFCNFNTRFTRSCVYLDNKLHPTIKLFLNRNF